MTRTLLLDLDDTLLGNSMEVFLPRYLGALGDFLAPHVAPDEMARHLFAAVQRMVSNQRPDRTLKQVFESHFYPALGVKPGDLQPHIDRFYEEVFPTLASLTEPRPEAIALVETCLARGHRLAVATNPLFPRVAIEERLRWAGLSVDDHAFEVVASMETFHFAKPNPAFFAEVLARMGWPEGPIVMVGDDRENDILPAQCLELATFWISSEDPATYGRPGSAHAAGRVQEVLPWLEATPDHNLTPHFEHPSALLEILRATPAALASLFADLPPDAWKRRPKLEEWAITEILCHLRDVEREVNLARLEKVLAEDNPRLEGQDTDAWAQKRRYLAQDGPAALVDFLSARQVTVELLESRGDDAWSRPARHTIFGPTDLLELVKIMAGHDRLHMSQIRETLAAITP